MTEHLNTVGAFHNRERIALAQQLTAEAFNVGNEAPDRTPAGVTFGLPRISKTPGEEGILGERSWKQRPKRSERAPGRLQA